MHREQLTEAANRFLSEYRQRADERLDAILSARRETAGKLPFGASRYFEHLQEYVLRGGKRFRGALVLLGYEAAGGEGGRDEPGALDASLSFELMHAGLLAHDDLMDRDVMRRGGDALHVLAAREAFSAGYSDSDHVGASVAVLLGMTAQAMGYDVLASAGFPSDRTAAAMRRLNEVFEGVVAGQLLDVCAAAAGHSTRRDIALIEQLKTGLYTTVGPLEVGAILAGATRESPVCQSLLAYGRPLGEAFQIVDDLLGTLGDSEETGKGAGDLREGKRTLLLEEALARTSGEDRKLLEESVGRAVDDETFTAIRRLLVECGAQEAVRDRAANLVKTAVNALESSPVHRESKKVLESMAHLVLLRRA